jgi:arsenate reductase (thioredoxin)
MTRAGQRTVLFLCTGNSARSIMAEAILNKAGAGTWRAYSAGSHPQGQVNQNALALLQTRGHATSDLRSKSWSEFAAPGAPVVDVVITVCDNAAGEACPIWPGRPVKLHWSIPDPALARGSAAEIAAAFADTYRMLSACIDAFLSLRAADADQAELETKLAAIGRTQGVGADKPTRV